MLRGQHWYVVVESCLCLQLDTSHNTFRHTLGPPTEPSQAHKFYGAFKKSNLLPSLSQRLLEFGRPCPPQCLVNQYRLHQEPAQQAPQPQSSPALHHASINTTASLGRLRPPRHPHRLPCAPTSFRCLNLQAYRHTMARTPAPSGPPSKI